MRLFSKVCLGWLVVSGVVPILVQERETPFQREICALILGRKREGRGLIAFSSKQRLRQHGIFWGGKLWSPSNFLMTLEVNKV